VIEPAEASAATAEISKLSLPGLSTITVYAQRLGDPTAQSGKGPFPEGN